MQLCNQAHRHPDSCPVCSGQRYESLGFVLQARGEVVARFSRTEADLFDLHVLQHISTECGKQIAGTNEVALIWQD